MIFTKFFSLGLFISLGMTMGIIKKTIREPGLFLPKSQIYETFITQKNEHYLLSEAADLQKEVIEELQLGEERMDGWEEIDSEYLPTTLTQVSRLMASDLFEASKNPLSLEEAKDIGLQLGWSLRRELFEDNSRWNHRYHYIGALPEMIALKRSRILINKIFAWKTREAKYRRYNHAALHLPSIEDVLGVNDTRFTRINPGQYNI